MGSKRSKKTGATGAADGAVEAKAPAPPAAIAASKQSSNALADMFAQSSVLFAKKASYAPGTTS